MVAPVLGPLCDFEARIIGLLGRIDATDVNRVVDLLLRFDASSAKPITVFVSCQGGDIVEGLKITDTLGLLRAPLTAVGMGLIEGAGVLLLASAYQRILYPSAQICTAGLWDLPHLHETARRGMGLHQGSDVGDQLITQLSARVKKLTAARDSRFPGLLANSKALPQVFDAPTAIEMGLADSIIEGPLRNLSKPKMKTNTHAKPGTGPSL